jgi:hypothetical protein
MREVRGENENEKRERIRDDDDDDDVARVERESEREQVISFCLRCSCGCYSSFKITVVCDYRGCTNKTILKAVDRSIDRSMSIFDARV